MGFTEVLTIVFVICKLFGVIHWNWFLVLLPEIIAVVLYIVFAIIGIYAQNKAMKHFDDFNENNF